MALLPSKIGGVLEEFGLTKRMRLKNNALPNKVLAGHLLSDGHSDSVETLAHLTILAY